MLPVHKMEISSQIFCDLIFNPHETTMSRFVTTFDDKLASRTVQAQKNEITLKCHILNILMAVNSQMQDSAA